MAVADAARPSLLRSASVGRRRWHAVDELVARHVALWSDHTRGNMRPSQGSCGRCSIREKRGFRHFVLGHSISIRTTFEWLSRICWLSVKSAMKQHATVWRDSVSHAKRRCVGCRGDAAKILEERGFCNIRFPFDRLLICCPVWFGGAARHTRGKVASDRACAGIMWPAAGSGVRLSAGVVRTRGIVWPGAKNPARDPKSITLIRASCGI